jgi:hypothetical protein
MLQLLGSHIGHEEFSAPRLLSIYETAVSSKSSRAFAPYIAGRLARHRTELVTALPLLKQRLAPAYLDDYILLLEHLAIASDSSTGSKTLRVSPKLTSLRRQMRQLLHSQEHADFTIQLGLTDIPCHTFVLAPRWTYFNRMMSMGGREVSEKRLKLPGIESKDGGLSFNALMSMLEFCYTGAVSDPTVGLLKLSDALDILSVADYYCLGYDDSNSSADFRPYLALLDEVVRLRCATGPVQVEMPRPKTSEAIFLDD